jgi:hypothetical protein
LRLLQPGSELLGNEWTDAFEFKERTSFGEEVSRVLRPEEGVAGCSLESALPNTLFAIRFQGEKLGYVTVRKGGFQRMGWASTLNMCRSLLAD